eukprot:11656961-Alexandrium_andersonii.AAC.1
MLLWQTDNKSPRGLAESERPTTPEHSAQRMHSRQQNCSRKRRGHSGCHVPSRRVANRPSPPEEQTPTCATTSSPELAGEPQPQSDLLSEPRKERAHGRECRHARRNTGPRGSRSALGHHP